MICKPLSERGEFIAERKWTLPINFNGPLIKNGIKELLPSGPQAFVA